MSTKNSTNTSKERERLVQDLIKLGEIYSTETALFQQRAADSLGIGVTDLKALSVLLRDGPMTISQLTKRLGLTTGAGTLLLDRLERARFIVRQPHGSDRRKVLVTMNLAKLSVTDEVYKPVGDAFKELLANFSIEELESLVRFHQDSIAMVTKEFERLPKAGTSPKE